MRALCYKNIVFLPVPQTYFFIRAEKVTETEWQASIDRTKIDCWTFSCSVLTIQFFSHFLASLSIEYTKQSLADYLPLKECGCV